ncbi:MAG: hypothetical protein NDJ94_08075 [Vicinamibacteria bacterium]|jgi:hypothetical protein|nr:hypothetical protein [Vicinamibacteria bacterium]
MVGRPLSRLALAAVAAVQLATLPDSWIVTDQGEALLSARRLLDAGTLTLADAGATKVPEAPWARIVAGEPVRSRLLPGTTLLLVPLLALERALGMGGGGGADFGVLVDAQGALCLLAALGLLHLALARRGIDDAAAATALAVLGLSWPAWMVAHRGGPEPALLALAAAFFAAADPRARGLVLAALPWFNPSGSVLACGLAAGRWAEQDGGLRARTWACRHELVSLIGGQALVTTAWNVGYHGHWLEGGYHLVSGRSAFGVVPPAEGLLRHATALLLDAPALVALAALGVRASGAVTAGIVLALHLVFFATYEFQEPARRLAPTLAVLAPLAAAGASRLAPALRAAAVALAAGAGLLHFFQAEGRALAGPHGLFYPSIVWVESWIAHQGTLVALLPLLVTTALAVLVGARLLARLSRAA